MERSVVLSSEHVVALYVGSLGLGGAQRVLTWLSKELTTCGHRVIFITDGDLSGGRGIFRPAPDVQHEIINLSEGRSSTLGKFLINFARIRKLREILRRNNVDTILAMLPRACVLAVLATRGLKCRAVIAERNAPWHRQEEQPWERLRRMVYRFSEAQVAQTSEIADWMQREAGCRAVRVIPNPVQYPIENLESGPDPAIVTNSSRRLLLAAGTKPWQKGFDLLVDSFARVSQDCPEWDLAIVGLRPDRSENGLSRNDIEQAAILAGLSSRVYLPGHVGNIADWYKASDAFVLSSRFEGFPNVLLEAMACGMPCVSFACETGPAEIIRDDVDGILVRDISSDALARALTRVMRDSDLRARLAQEAPKVVGRFAPAAILEKWCAVLGLPTDNFSQ